jgi:hypothetical protein
MGVLVGRGDNVGKSRVGVSLEVAFGVLEGRVDAGVVQAVSKRKKDKAKRKKGAGEKRRLRIEIFLHVIRETLSSVTFAAKNMKQIITPPQACVTTLSFP